MSPMISTALRFKLSTFFLALMSVCATAQTTESCQIEFQFCGPCGDTGWPGMECVAEGPFLSVCRIPHGACPPKAAAEECICGNEIAGQPVNCTNGNTFIVQNDVSLPGLGGGLALVRRWNSLWPTTQMGFQMGMFGMNWRSNLEERVFVGSDGYVKYLRGEGSFWSMAHTSLNTPMVVAAPANASATLVSEPTQWVVTHKGGERRFFTKTSGSITAISDRNGNTTQFTYDGANRLVTVTDAAGRHLYFTHGHANPQLVTAVTSDFGVSLAYTYDSAGRLVSVTRPDNTTVTFEYDVNSRITAVKDSEGKVLEAHTYDSKGRGLSSTRANGVESLTLTFPAIWTVP